MFSQSVAQSSTTPANKVKVNVDELQQLPASEEAVTTGEGNLMNRRKLGIAAAFVCRLAAASVVPAVVYSIVTNNDNDCIFLISAIS